jgi:hypothetical protein
MEDKYNWREAKEYAESAQRFGRVEWKVTQAARDALAALEGDEADTLRLAEAIGKSHLKEEDPELWRQADELSPQQRLAAFKLAVNYLEDGESHAVAIRRAIRRIKEGG